MPAIPTEVWTIKINLRPGEQQLARQLVEKLLDYDDVLDARLLPRPSQAILDEEGVEA